MQWTFILRFSILIVASACTPQHFSDPDLSHADSRLHGDIDGAGNTNNKTNIQTTKEGVKYLVHPNDILSGGPPKDGIPSIDNPHYVTVETADEWISDNELVLALEWKGIKRVYPLQILVWHEIVNDNVGGDPLLITYCPLCGSGIAYLPIIEFNGVRINATFGTSGKLYNSNLIMYDRKTATYWQQIDGKAIVGDLVGQELKEISIDTVTWREWKESHPDSEVLSQETGFDRQYGRDPYGSYYEDSNLFFPVNQKDNRIHPKDFIYGIEIDGSYKAYRKDDVATTRIIFDTLNGVNLKLQQLPDGRVVVTRVDTGEEIVKEVEFWFAWYAFHPETDLYTA